jgi:hypothetical protein
MAEQCFVRKGSDPPVCDVHNARLKQHQSAENSGTARFGDFTFLMCPISGQIIDPPGNRK